MDAPDGERGSSRGSLDAKTSGGPAGGGARPKLRNGVITGIFVSRVRDLFKLVKRGIAAAIDASRFYKSSLSENDSDFH